MEARKKFAEILRKDGQMKLLLSGMVVDGVLMLALVIAAGVIAF
jgi:hypothetical protein